MKATTSLILGYFVLPLLQLITDNPSVKPLYGLTGMVIVVSIVIILLLNFMFTKLVGRWPIGLKVYLGFLAVVSVAFLWTYLPISVSWLVIPFAFLGFYLTWIKFKLISRFCAFMLVPFILVVLWKCTPHFDFFSRPERNLPKLEMNESAPQNVIMIMLDGSDMTSFNLAPDLYPRADITPFFSSILKSDFSWFPNAFSNGSYTEASLPLIFSGHSELKESFSSFKYTNLLFELLAQNYRPVVFPFLEYYLNFCNQRVQRCYPFKNRPFYSGFFGMKAIAELYLKRLTFGFSSLSFLGGIHFRAEDMQFFDLRDLRRFLANDSSDQRSFFYVHMFARTPLQQGHFDQTFYEFIKKLKQKNLYEKSLIFIVSDHGIDYSQEGYKYGKHTKHNEITFRVPLAIKWHVPSKPLLIAKKVQNLDIFPTILAQIYRNPPKSDEGVNLREQIPDKRNIRLYCDDVGLMSTVISEKEISECR